MNLGQGAVVTESRAIFIQGLNYNAGANEVTSLVYNIGLQPTSVKILKDSKGNSKGCASVEFNRKEDAQYAIDKLNGKTFMERTLTVRPNTDTTVVAAIPPVIFGGAPVVDGTSKRRVSAS